MYVVTCVNVVMINYPTKRIKLFREKTFHDAQSFTIRALNILQYSYNDIHQKAIKQIYMYMYVEENSLLSYIEWQ